MVTLRDDGVVLINGTPFFPLGLFSTYDSVDPEFDFEVACAEMAAAGFNMGQIYHNGDPGNATMLEFYAACTNNGMKCFISPHTASSKNYAVITQNVIDHQDIAPLLSWYIGDDTSSSLTPAELLTIHNICKDNDANHLTSQADYLGEGTYDEADPPTNYADYVNCSDIFLPEIYCFSDDAGAQIPIIIHNMKSVYTDITNAGASGKAIWTIIQNYIGWGKVVFPTAIQLRCMTYLALCHGATGIVYYTYFTSSGGADGCYEDPAQWTITKALASEVAQLKDVFTEAAPTQTATMEVTSGPTEDELGFDSISLRLMEHDNKWYLIAANSTDQAVDATITAPQLTGLVTVEFESRTVTPSAGTFDDSFDAFGVHVYSWDIGSVGTILHRYFLTQNDITAPIEDALVGYDFSAQRYDNVILGDGLNITGHTLNNVFLEGEHITYVPLDADIQDYIDSAASGDTLVLASGTYTLTAELTVNKSLNIVGQGIDHTILITSSNIYLFDVTASDVRIADMTITNTSATTVRSILFNGEAGDNITDCIVQNVDVIYTSATNTTATGIFYYDANGTVTNCHITATLKILDNGGIRCEVGPGAEAATTINIYNSSVVATITGTASASSYALYVYEATSPNDVIVNIHNSQFKGIEAGTNVIYAGYATGSDAILTAYKTIFDGETDLAQASSAVVTIHGCTLVNHTSSGTIISDPKSRSFVIPSPTVDHDFPLWTTPRAITLIEVRAICTNGTNVIGQLQEYDSNITNPIDVDGADWTITTAKFTDVAFTNPGIAAWNTLGWKTTSVDGEVDALTLTFFYMEP